MPMPGITDVGAPGAPVIVTTGTAGKGRSGQDMDEERQQQVAYEYLCRLEEAKKWIEACIQEELPSTTELEEWLRNGIYLAKLANFFAPSVVPLRRIFDKDFRKYNETGLHFRHTDNINFFLQALNYVGLPQIFAPETTDIYDKKNMPRTIFCIHALSLYLFKLGIAPQILDLYGKVTFTDEEISNMRKALNEYGLPMPQFRKIGGILADEMPVDEAALHAAIIAINEAISQSYFDATLAALQNPSTCLNDVEPDNIRQYHIVLANAKKEKVETAYNRTLDNSYIPDAYDELLTQAEIQGHINQINLLLALEAVEKAVRNRDNNALLLSLRSRYLNLAGIKSGNTDKYMRELEHAVASIGDDLLRKEMIVSAIHSANRQGGYEDERKAAVKKLNEAIASGDPDETVRCLMQPILDLRNIIPFAAPLYYEELAYVQTSSNAPLSYEGIVSLVKFLNVIAAINKGVTLHNTDETWRWLNDKDANIEDLEGISKKRYQDALFDAVVEKQRQGAMCYLLTHLEIQDIIDSVNRERNTDFDRINAIEEVNKAVRYADYKALHKAMMNPVLDLQNVVQEHEVPHYLTLLQEIRHNRSMAENEESELWMENILDAVHTANRHAQEAQSAGTALAIVNMALQQGDAEHTFNTLENQSLNMSGSVVMVEGKRSFYQEKLMQKMKEKERLANSCPWVSHTLFDGHQVYLNLQSHDFVWRRPFDFGTSHFLNVSDIEECLNQVNHSLDKENKYKAFEAQLIRFQAACRGFITRNRLFKMLQHYYDNESKVVRAQAVWRGALTRKRFRTLLDRKRNDRRNLRPLNFYRPYMNHILMIQRNWRQYKNSKDFQSLMDSKEITLSVVRKYLHLLDMRNEDFEQELELQALKGQITRAIRHNQTLERDLDTMDIKIGLLVKNRISVEDVVAHGKQLTHKKDSHHKKDTGDHGTMGTGTQRGLKALRKESREKLDAYQNLFYLLQTRPAYLAKLIFLMPQSKTTIFLESVILTLYNYGANQREEYLLLKLFKTALEEEVHSKVEKLTDIITGQPLVIKMIVSFNRNGKGQNSLREMLGPLIHRILEDKTLHINTNPVEIYKQWVNQLECESGKPSGMPYDISQEAALKHDEVQKRLNRSITKLKQVTTLFLATIVKSKAKMPYGMLYMAKVLYNALKAKFSHAHQKELLKTIGNLIYYRFINSAIVAPDAFDIVNMKADNNLNNDQRRNLGSIAKVLQFAASKKGFGEESPHLVCLNPYIVECHEKFKKFFHECCDVPEPEDEFHMDQYTEATLIAKPVIYISLQELCDTHQLLLDNQDQLAPDPTDYLHELLEDLGEQPSLCSLLGATDPSQSGASLSHLGKTEVCLTLTNKFEVPAVDRSDTDKLFIKTKQFIMFVLPCTKENNLIGCLKSKTTKAQERLYYDMVLKRMEATKQAEQNRTMLDHTNHFKDDDGALTLEDCKKQILKNLRILEVAGYVSSKDGCQAIISSLAKDICNQKDYRSRRRREIYRLRRTLLSLQRKTKFHEEQVDYYNQYLKQCLANLGTGKKRVHFRRSQDTSKMKSRLTLRYSATRLFDKGILLAIDGLPTSQFKNVLFEIVPTDQNGLFEIHAKFMGVRMEHVDVDIQELLQLQYEGVSVMNMFGKARINVNLLLHFLNTKFYGRKK